MEDKRIINQLIENNEERVEAVPGPAIVISKETYKKMQENNQAKQNKERLERLKDVFDKIHDETNTNGTSI
ncbi:MAG: hypothetical protein IJA72_00480 [Clostridia bacterium]|nr:hypothetical protein [Clostridia bacterium]